MKSLTRAFLALSLAPASGLLLVPGQARAADQSLPAKAREILKVHCYRCHGLEGAAKGGMSFVLDRGKLVARQKIVPGDAAASALYQRMLHGEMPPEGAKPRPSRDDLGLLRQWIEAGAPPALPPPGKRDFISEPDVLRVILADLKTLNPRQRRFARYLTFCNLYNAGVADEDLQVYRHALSKLVNSLSWHPRVAVPWPVDAAQTIYRIDLRDLQWSATTWSRILTAYPYPLPQTSTEAKAEAAAAGSELAHVRADWFVATASRPPLYHDILQLPLTDRDLERQLRVDVPLDIQEERVIRAGFNGSGVSKNNRILERHDAGFGAYWRSYDFSDNVDRQNIFDHPLGPLPGQNSFQHAGGEIIFNLPNGLQAYLLVDANGRRLDRAPIEIVSDPKRPDRIVETGISCMSCHVHGIIHKADQVRAHVDKNPNAFGGSDAEIVKALYPAEKTFKALVQEDAARFEKAVARTGAPAAEPEPITALTRRFEGELDLAAAAAETGLKPEDFSRRLGESAILRRPLGTLNVRGGTVQRQVFQTAFADLVREFRLADDARSVAASGSSVPLAATERRPFEGHTGPVTSVAFSADGRRALSGGADHSIRLWDVAGGREVRSFEGHTDEVLAVAFSPDGKKVLSGGSDRTVRLWDALSGRELNRFEGHTERISSVAFSPDGRRALSGSWDQTLILWDLAGGRELRRLAGHGGYVSSVAFSPDGRRALSGGYDKTVRLWDLENGREVRRFEGSSREVYAVAFSPDGRQALSGGNDRTVRLWEVETGRLLRALEGHGKAVIRVAFTADGKRLLSGNSRYDGTGQSIRVWDAETGRLSRSPGSTSDTIWSIAFTADGSRALSGSDKTLRLWNLSK